MLEYTVIAFCEGREGQKSMNNVYKIKI